MKPQLNISTEDVFFEIEKHAKEEAKAVNMLIGEVKEMPAGIRQHRIDRRRTNKYRGVQKNHTGKKIGNTYRARIHINGRVRHIGGFSTAKKAAKAYDKIAKALYGVNAILNFPEEKQNG